MSEHHEIASALEPVVDGIWHWHVDGEGDGEPAHIESGHAVRVELEDGRVGCVLVDPVRLDGHAMQQLPHVVVAIVLTSAEHQRDTWRLRRHHRAPVWAPFGARGLEEEPDVRFRIGQHLPGGLVAIEHPDGGEATCALHLPAREALFVADVSPRMAQLAELHPRVLLRDHGMPIADGGDREVERALVGA